jgi:hypothetical protein
MNVENVPMKLKYYITAIIFSFSCLVFVPSISYAMENECEECQEGDEDCPKPDGSDAMSIEIGE